MTSDTYRFIGLDGTEAEYSFDDLSGAYLQLDSSGNAVFPSGYGGGKPDRKSSQNRSGVIEANLQRRENFETGKK